MRACQLLTSCPAAADAAWDAAQGTTNLHSRACAWKADKDHVPARQSAYKLLVGFLEALPPERAQRHAASTLEALVGLLRQQVHSSAAFVSSPCHCHRNAFLRMKQDHRSHTVAEGLLTGAAVYLIPKPECVELCHADV